jgi:hypothetical protein
MRMGERGCCRFYYNAAYDFVKPNSENLEDLQLPNYSRSKHQRLETWHISSMRKGQGTPGENLFLQQIGGHRLY